MSVSIDQLVEALIADSETDDEKVQKEREIVKVLAENADIAEDLTKKFNAIAMIQNQDRMFTVQFLQTLLTHQQ